jgi:hypothetical protein
MRALGGPSVEDVDNNRKYTFPSHAANREVSKENTEEPDRNSPWQTVERRRARSLDSADPAPEETGQRGQHPKKKIPATTTKQSNVAQTVTEVPRPEAAHTRREMSVESRREGPLQSKGKNRDPHEWGNIHLDENEIDTAVQQAAYESYKEQDQHDRNKEKHRQRHKSNKNRDPLQRQSRPPESRPVAQIALDSFLGVAFRNLERRGGGSSDDPTSSSSSDSESESDDNQSETG